jgi:hypothetical protein
VHQVFHVSTLAGVACNLATVYAGLHAGTGVHVTYSGSPGSIIENET